MTDVTALLHRRRGVVPARDAGPADVFRGRNLRPVGLALAIVAGWLLTIVALDPHAAEVAAGLLVLGVAATGLAILLRVLRARLVAGRALERMARSVGRARSPATLRRELAVALADPTVELVFPAGDSRGDWVDETGRPVDLPAPGSGRTVSEVRARSTLLAAVVHDERRRARRGLVDACVAMAGVVLDNRRLAAEAATSLREVQQSRSRIAAGAARERRRIERDLHDGAQQRLVVLRIKLALAEELVQEHPERGAALLRNLGDVTEEALEELRSLAKGVYPPLLADRGLAEAVRAAAARSPIPVDLHASGLPRFSTEVESAVYFCILEALQNVAKHATGARRAVVRIEHTRAELRFSVGDDGAGLPAGPVRAGSGLTNIRDRLTTLSGDVEVTSTPGAGTLVAARVPTGDLGAVATSAEQ